ncbi:MAG: hypothetical protein KDI63_13785 [Gammaproteobacteria bacterium]|nr:hypothetical protein [Gammaproteobacteria bacterium]
MKLDRETLCGLIPHAGVMCLIDRVEAWDEKQIICTTRSHSAANNPLRSEGGLSVINALEYGAQAMAIHSGLWAREKRMCISEGYVAAVRDAKFYTDRIDQVEQPLIIEAIKLISSDATQIYQIKVSVMGKLVAAARLTVVNRVETKR